MQQESLVLGEPPVPPEERPQGVRSRYRECPVCFGKHEDQIHEATLSVHQWFRDEVTKSFRVVYLE